MVSKFGISYSRVPIFRFHVRLLGRVPTCSPFVHFGWFVSARWLQGSLRFLALGKRCVSQICLEKVQKFHPFFCPLQKKLESFWDPQTLHPKLCFEIFNLFGLGVLPELELPPEESQRMHVETSACVWYSVHNADYLWLRVDMYSTKNAIYLMITEILAKHCLNSLLVPNYSPISSISVLPRFFLPATLRTSAPPVLPPTKCTSPTPNPDPFEAEQEQTSHRSGDQTNSDDMTWQLLGMSRLEAGRNS